MTSSNDLSTSSSSFEAKDSLFSLFYELLSEIKGKKIELDEEEYENNVRTTPINQIINYVRETLHMLFRKYGQKERKCSEEPTKEEVSQFENMLRYQEQKNRMNIGKLFQYKLHQEVLQEKVQEYEEMENEFEEMKVQLKYEEGKFLDNDRKDNEIFIIRSENTNLKRIISDKDKSINELNEQIKEKDFIIKDLKEKLEKVSQKLKKAENDLNLFSNINININNNSSPLNLRYSQNADEMNKRTSQIKLLNLKSIKHKFGNQSNSCKAIHHRNNSMTSLFDHKKVDLLSKYLTSKKRYHGSFTNNSNFKKIMLPLNITQLSNRNNVNECKYLSNRESSCKNVSRQTLPKEQELQDSQKLKHAFLSKFSYHNCIKIKN